MKFALCAGGTPAVRGVRLELSGEEIGRSRQDASPVSGASKQAEHGAPIRGNPKREGRLRSR